MFKRKIESELYKYYEAKGNPKILIVYGARQIGKSYIIRETANLIYEVRGMQVMLDSDVAFFFGEKTERINQQMKRNLNRFPEDFCFKLNYLEFKNLTLQNAIFKRATKSRKHTPHMYTEHGIIALAGVLKSEIAAVKVANCNLNE